MPLERKMIQSITKKLNSFKMKRIMTLTVKKYKRNKSVNYIRIWLEKKY